MEVSESYQLWLLEGILAKTNMLLRKEIRDCTHTHRKSSKSSHSSRVPRSLELPIQLKSATKFVTGVELIHSLIHEDPNVPLSQPTQNLILDWNSSAINWRKWKLYTAPIPVPHSESLFRRPIQKIRRKLSTGLSLVTIPHNVLFQSRALLRIMARPGRKSRLSVMMKNSIWLKYLMRETTNNLKSHSLTKMISVLLSIPDLIYLPSDVMASAMVFGSVVVKSLLHLSTELSK